MLRRSVHGALPRSFSLSFSATCGSTLLGAREQHCFGTPLTFAAVRFCSGSTHRGRGASSSSSQVLPGAEGKSSGAAAVKKLQAELVQVQAKLERRLLGARISNAERKDIIRLLGNVEKRERGR